MSIKPTTVAEVAVTLGLFRRSTHVRMMTATLASLLLATTLGGTAAPQWPPYASPNDLQAERHRLEMDRLRLRADQRDLYIDQQALRARQTLMDLRLSAPAVAPSPPPLVSTDPDAARRERERQTTRRETIQGSVPQIDDWLDRPPQD